MTNAVKELRPENFTERLEPIFRHIEKEINEPGRLNSAHFFPCWRRLMELGVARTWETEGAVLGAIYSPDPFSGKTRAHVCFWFSLPEARGTGETMNLLITFEQASKKAGCTVISSSASMKVNPGKLSRIYLHRGYFLSEQIYSKDL